MITLLRDRDIVFQFKNIKLLITKINKTIFIDSEQRISIFLQNSDKTLLLSLSESWKSWKYILFPKIESFLCCQLVRWFFFETEIRNTIFFKIPDQTFLLPLSKWFFLFIKISYCLYKYTVEIKKIQFYFLMNMAFGFLFMLFFFKNCGV